MSTWKLIGATLFGGICGAFPVAFVLAAITADLHRAQSELRLAVDQRNHLSEQLANMTKQRDKWIELYGVLADEKNVLEADK